jgi:hypothetical protein
MTDYYIVNEHWHCCPNCYEIRKCEENCDIKLNYNESHYYPDKQFGIYSICDLCADFYKENKSKEDKPKVDNCKKNCEEDKYTKEFWDRYNGIT